MNVDGTVISWVKSSSRVPQGTILGPLIFAFFINDFPTVLRSVSYMLYADDTQIYGHFTLVGISDIATMQNNALAVFD